MRYQCGKQNATTTTTPAVIFNLDIDGLVASHINGQNLYVGKIWAPP